MINQNQVALAKKLLESKGYEVSKKMTESPDYSGHDVSKDLKSYLVTVIIGNSDGDRETGMTEPESYTELVSAMDEDDAKRQVEKGLNPGDGIADVHLATEEEIAEWEYSAYEYMDESKKKMNESDSVDDRQQRRIVRDIANEVIQSRGENNSIGTYDAFIRKMINHWATSGQDRDFIEAAIEKSFDKEFRVKESKTITIFKPDDLVGHNPKFRVTYSSAPGETTSMTIEATDERAVEAIISGRFKRRGKNPPKFLSIERVSDIKESSESPHTESREGWSYYEMPKDFKGPWTATQYTKDIDDLYLTIYPPQRVSGTTNEESKDWHAEVERADGKSDPINTYQTGLSSFEEAEKWINEWIASHKKSMNESADKFKVGDLIVGNESGNFYRVKEITPTHYVCDDLQGHGIAKLFKHRVNRTFSLEESKNPHTEQYKGYSIQSYDDYGATIYKNGKKIREFENIDDAREYIDELNESKKTKSVKVQESKELDYKDMQYWNPVAIGNEIAEYLGVKATEEEIKAELSKIIPDTKSPRFQRALEKALLKIEMDKESMNEDPMQGHKYLVSGNTSNVTETGTDRNIYNGGYTEDPREAIITWLKLSQKAPTSISIDTNKNAAADELLAWVVDNEEEFRDLCAQYKAPYKVDYLVDACKRGNRHDFEKGKYNYPDQVHPFSIG